MNNKHLHFFLLMTLVIVAMFFVNLMLGTVHIPSPTFGTFSPAVMMSR